MKFTCLTAAILYALWQSLPKPLFWYLVWQLIYTLTVFATASFFYADTTWQYALVFSAFTVPILWCVCRLTWDSVQWHKAKWLALLTGLLAAIALARLAYLGFPRPIAYWDWIALATGFLLSFAGVSAGLSLPYVPQKRVLAVLTCLWLAQSFWQFGFPQYFHSWVRLNWDIPPLLCIVAFLFIGRWAGVPPRQRKPHLR